MPTPVQQNAADIETLKHRMDKYDTIIDNLHIIVTRLDARHENNTAWIKGLLAAGSIAVTVLGIIVGAIGSHLLH